MIQDINAECSLKTHKVLNIIGPMEEVELSQLQKHNLTLD